ncbi:Methyl-accepting chemotaxis protein (MCP) signaling domain-containing protein [Dioscorea alata]|uniref:Methyl-accepting chemotaxis protein (MCP) signaling domain-containing protein n=1 Tax=Dioscorea alata TaxID=55571 RepID=A0ACB7W879_DIOAL|nr:Methyl-accepting chemotaxis protein (MCP) signaling domain-containing protein [Dioscorea alata]
MANLLLQILLFVLTCLYTQSFGLSWPFSSSASSTPPPHFHGDTNALNRMVTEFSMDDVGNDPRAVKLIENAKERLLSSNSCWQSAYQNLFAGCSEILSDKDKQSRLAWLLTDCFQKDSGRPTLPSCNSGAQMLTCLKKLDDAEHKVYLEFFLETNSICHQLQASAFKHDTERLVNGLAKSARFAETQLNSIVDKSEKLLQGSSEIHDSLTSIDIKTERMAQTSREIDSKIQDVLKHSEAIFEQSRGISASQSELQERQTELKVNLESGMALVRESYESLGDGIEKVRVQTVEIEKEIMEVGVSMSSKMKNLQSTANDIGNVAGMSLDRQRQLLDGQATALQGLDFLTKFQSQALQESRDALQKLAEFGEKQQAELLKKQEQIQHAHDSLIQNSQSILSAQEEFERKQANVFAALEKLFTLHNTFLAESRFIKSFLFYSCVIFLLYMLTSTKQTFSIRARLYIGLCTTFVLELVIIRLSDGDLLQQTWITSQVFVARSSFLAVASIQLIYAIFTYRDYEVLNHQLLQKLIDKVNIMEQNSGKKLLSLSIETDSCSSNLSQYSWIDKELLEDVDSKIDPNYIFPEEVCENSITTTSITRKYDLRPRRRSPKLYS